MDSHVKELWVKALRSGEYQQGQGFLHEIPKDGSPAKFCCLGVLCDIAYQNGVVERKLHNNIADEVGDNYYYGVESPSGAFLPPEVKDWAKMGSGDPRVGEIRGRGEVSLIDLNDEIKADFEEIANRIENYL